MIELTNLYLRTSISDNGIWNSGDGSASCDSKYPACSRIGQEQQIKPTEKIQQQQHLFQSGISVRFMIDKGIFLQVGFKVLGFVFAIRLHSNTFPIQLILSTGHQSIIQITEKATINPTTDPQPITDIGNLPKTTSDRLRTIIMTNIVTNLGRSKTGNLIS